MFCEIRCLVRQRRFSAATIDVDDVPLPVVGHAAEVRLVADLEVEVVELVQLGDDLPHQRLLGRQQVAVA